MPKLPFYQVDAFATKPFEGNQACVMPLDEFLPDATLLAIAAENNVSETAYIVRTGEDSWNLRWFTPAVEVPLCGHATLASAHVLFNELGFAGETLKFDTVKSGRLSVSRLDEARLEMDLPAYKVHEIPVTDDIAAALGDRPVKAWGGAYYAAMFERPEQIVNLKVDHAALKVLGVDSADWPRGNFGCFAPGGDGVDVTSRVFGPGSGIPEDPATGSWHAMLAPVMKAYAGLDTLRCFQAYPGRGAFMETRLEGDRVKLSGRSVTVIEGSFTL